MIVFSPDSLSDIERIREFLDINNPEAAKRALRVIFAALEKVQEFPDLGRPTEDAEMRQIVIRFGAAGYIVRYTILPETGDVLVLRVWHGREVRS
jgi:plasmid stabilization system protein ParE